MRFSPELAGFMRRPGGAAVLAVCAVFASANLQASSKEPEAARGQAIYQRCSACHSPDRNRTGPMHCGVVGRAAGAVPGFEYSDALRRSGIVWTDEILDAFLAAPLTVVPGTTMAVAGISSADDRRSLIEYLKYLSTELCDGNSR